MTAETVIGQDGPDVAIELDGAIGGEGGHREQNKGKPHVDSYYIGGFPDRGMQPTQA
jgi:hypothetical protein